MDAIELVKIECYIEEYNVPGRTNPGARLRDKKTNKRVSVIGESAQDKEKFIQFLSQAKRFQSIMPTVFQRDGRDIVAVRGLILEEDDEEILVNPYVPNGGYLFE